MAAESISEIVKIREQPRGGFIPTNALLEIKIGEPAPNAKETENIHPSIIGLVVDYVSLLTQNIDFYKVFGISYDGHEKYKKYLREKNISDFFPIEEAEWQIRSTMQKQKWWNNDDKLDTVIKAAIDIVQFDRFSYQTKKKAMQKKPFHHEPNLQTMENLRHMIRLMPIFVDKMGMVTNGKPGFVGAGTKKISDSIGDFLTADTLWDFKTQDKPITNKETFQILLYWIMGWHAVGEADFAERKKLTKIGIFNPRLGCCYVYDLKNLPKEYVQKIEDQVFEYQDDKNTALDFYK